jgi:folate-binding protein YgfZ
MLDAMEPLPHRATDSGHTALTTTAGVLDLGARGRLCLLGADRANFLHGQVTNDIKRLATGRGCRALLVTNKGRIQGDLDVWNLGDELLLDFEPGETDRVRGRLEKFLVADDVQIVDVTPHYGLLSVQGPHAAEVVAALNLFPEMPPQPWMLAAANDPALGQVYAMNLPRLGTAGFDLFIPVATAGAVLDRLVAAAKRVGGGVCGMEAFEVARVEAGVARFGAELDETVLPPEAGLDAAAVSYSKGCYIGQEVLNRIRTIGHVNRALVGLRIDDNTAPLPVKGDKLLADGKEVGVITSAVKSPRLGAAIAMGYVRRERTAPGTRLTLACGSTMRVTPIPFAA